MARTPEPAQLRRGKAFHSRTQAEWHATAEGRVSTEKAVRKISGSRGRMDVHIESDERLVGVVELKATKWNPMTTDAVRRNVARHAKQIWAYIEAELALGHEVSPGVIYPEMPTSAARRDMIESLFEEAGISVVWEDESSPGRARRTFANKPPNPRLQPTPRTTVRRRG